jgi:RNA polymerase sigma factor (sigma-70 family)
MAGEDESHRRMGRSADDTELATRLRHGDPLALGALYERYAAAIYTFLVGLLHDPTTAEDLTQTTFVQAFEHRLTLREPARVRSWLFTIAHHLALDQLARARPSLPPEALTTLASGERGVEDIVIAQEAAALVWEAAASLDPRQYAVLDLTIRQGLSIPEVAETLGIPVRHAAVLVHRAREALGSAVRDLLLARQREACPRLAELVPPSEAGFTVEQRRSIDRHLRRCDVCQRLASEVTDPAQILGALPLLQLPERLQTHDWTQVLTRIRQLPPVQHAPPSYLTRLPSHHGWRAHWEERMGHLLARVTAPPRPIWLTASSRLAWLAAVLSLAAAVVVAVALAHGSRHSAATTRPTATTVASPTPLPTPLPHGIVLAAKPTPTPTPKFQPSPTPKPRVTPHPSPTPRITTSLPRQPVLSRSPTPHRTLPRRPRPPPTPVSMKPRPLRRVPPIPVHIAQHQPPIIVHPTHHRSLSTLHAYPHPHRVPPPPTRSSPIPTPTIVPRPTSTPPPVPTATTAPTATATPPATLTPTTTPSPTSTPRPTEPTTGVLAGRVTSATLGIPIPDATVQAVYCPATEGSCTTSTTLTNWQGAYLIRSLRPGRYQVSVQAIAYYPAGPVLVTVVRGRTTIRDFSLVPIPRPRPTPTPIPTRRTEPRPTPIPTHPRY